jgi:uncharacterized protein (TIGR03790 family)
LLRHHHFLLATATVLLLGIATSEISAQLRPEQVGIVALKGSRESTSVARYYAKVRGIPEAHIFLFDAPRGTSLDRDVWERQVRPAIRTWLKAPELDGNIRCLVTIWDVPLTITGSRQLAPDSDLAAHLREAQQDRIQRLRELATQAYAAVGEQDPPRSDPPPSTAQELVREIEKALLVVQTKMKDAPETEVTKTRDALRNALMRMGGWSVIVRQLAQQVQQAGESASNTQQQFELRMAQARLLGEREGLAAIQALPESITRDQQILALLDVSDGWAGSLRWTEQQLEMIEKNESYSSFDSELSLVLWPEHPLLRWQVNLLNARYDANPGVRQSRPTLMVSRIEAPTLALTKQMIDTPVAVEQKGLQGKFYLDARGLTKPLNPENNAYWEFDESLNRLGEALQDQQQLPVVIDTKEELFAPGSSPDAALYCGWYSLGKYVDAFDWTAGAVGYHLASAEAKTLRDPSSEVWCKRMLEDGVCATLGPVFEPYLPSFPKPDEFFPLLLTGKYTLVECFYRTKPFNSWVMVLVGDPLYNPFGKQPVLQMEDLPEALRSQAAR